MATMANDPHTLDTHNPHVESHGADVVAHYEAERGGRNPDLPPNHPINALSGFRKFMILVSLSFSGFLGQFTAAIILVAFPPMAADLKASIGDIANSVGFVLLGLAVGPLFWNPLSRVGLYCIHPSLASFSLGLSPASPSNQHCLLEPQFQPPPTPLIHQPS